jgi:hypothetical protein
MNRNNVEKISTNCNTKLHSGQLLFVPVASVDIPEQNNITTHQMTLNKETVHTRKQAVSLKEFQS